MGHEAETRDELWSEKTARVTFWWLVICVVLFALAVFVFIL
ncbi:MAG: hypothetical protein ACRENS_04735 [Candidatus Eiseniibacteriota bacterium]